MLLKLIKLTHVAVLSVNGNKKRTHSSVLFRETGT